MCHPRGKNLVTIRSEETVKISASTLCQWSDTGKISTGNRINDKIMKNETSLLNGHSGLSSGSNNDASTVLDDVIATIYTP